MCNCYCECNENLAVEHGATHFTHWFTPMTGLTAEKHDAFLEPDGSKAVLEFSGKTLRKENLMLLHFHQVV